MENIFSIGKLAKQTGSKPQTIRYYEEVGLLPKANRSPGNQRVYSKAHLDRLTFIRHSRELGFPLDSIRELLALSDDPNHSCEDVDRIAGQHLANVRDRIARLEALEKELGRMLQSSAHGTVGDCRVISVLSDHALCSDETHKLAAKDTFEKNE